MQARVMTRKTGANQTARVLVVHQAPVVQKVDKGAIQR